MLQVIRESFTQLERITGAYSADLIADAKTEIQTAVTLLEGRIIQCMKLAGLAKKKHMNVY